MKLSDHQFEFLKDVNPALIVALNDYGIKEVSTREKDNPVIINYFKEIGHEWVKNDETAWCSAFVNYCCKVAGVTYSGKLNARSWLDVGKKVLHPYLGDIVVLWRESIDSWKGHVGFYISDDNEYIYILGGNQDNMVCIKPYKKTMLLSYIRL